MQQVPQIALYNLTQNSGWENFSEKVVNLPKLLAIAPWQKSSPEEIIKEALQRNIILDTLPEFVKDVEKIRPSKAYFETKEATYPFPSEVSTDWKTACAVEFPWRNGHARFVILPQKEAFLFLTSSRNELIIPNKAQKVFKTLKVGFAGAGVGSSLVEGVVRAGVQNIIVADGGDISFHDLNRLQSPSVASIGENHAINSARKTLETNPYANVTCIPKNLGEHEDETTFPIEKFLENIDILFEEVDNLAIKIAIREAARARNIPVIMATDVAFGTIIEYQKGETNAPIFPLMSEEEKKKVKENVAMTLSEKTALAVKMVGREAAYWQTGITKGLTFWSQTGAAADASKAKAVQTLVKWALGEELPTKQVYL